MKKLAKMILTLLLAMGIGPVMSMDNVTPKYHEGAHAHTPQSLVEWIENRVKGQLNFIHDPSLDKRILFGQDRDDLEKAFQDLKIMYGTQEIPQAIKERIIEIAKDLGLDYWVDVFEKSGKASTDPTEQLPEEVLSKILVQAHPQTLTTGPQIGTKWNASSKRDPDFQDLKLLEHVHMNNGVIDLGKGWEDKISPFGDNVTDNLLQRVIERFPDVQILWIDSSQVSDMNPLVKTHNLQILNLTGTKDQ
ncbi:MAG: hypothetical protein K2X98_04605 [Alphaproteobacteria bacterium]|nr:hypothetical protein [Alphaproteobacteria bacterium]